MYTHSIFMPVSCFTWIHAIVPDQKESNDKGTLHTLYLNISSAFFKPAFISSPCLKGRQMKTVLNKVAIGEPKSCEPTTNITVECQDANRAKRKNKQAERRKESTYSYIWNERKKSLRKVICNSNMYVPLFIFHGTA